jgi:hypothetical protein
LIGVRLREPNRTGLHVRRGTIQAANVRFS